MTRSPILPDGEGRKGLRWIPTRSATPSTALVPQRKVGFPIPNAGLLLGFQGTKTARREGISSPFSDAGCCTFGPQNSRYYPISDRSCAAQKPLGLHGLGCATPSFWVGRRDLLQQQLQRTRPTLEFRPRPGPTAHDLAQRQEIESETAAAWGRGCVSFRLVAQAPNEVEACAHLVRDQERFLPRPWSVIVDGRWPTEVEMIAIPNVGLDDPPTADECAVRWRAHAGVVSSLGNRARL